MQDILTIELNQNYLFNAGILGIINTLVENSATGGYTNEGYSVEDDVDYVIDGGKLMINKDYLRNNDIASMYVAAIAKKYEKFVSIDKILDKRNEIKELFDINPRDSKTESKIRKLIKEFIDICAKSSIKIVFDKENGERYSKFREFNKDTNLDEAYEEYKYFSSLITSNKAIKDRIIFTKAIHSHLPKFFTYNKNKMSIFAVDSQPTDNYTIINKIKEDVVDAIIKEPRTESTYQCINCFSSFSPPDKLSSSGKKKLNLRNTGFLVTGADDVSRKKSRYWDMVVDAYLCPVCCFVYYFAPLGFAYTGGDEIFINDNSSIKRLESTMLKEMGSIEDETNQRTSAALYVRRFVASLTNEEIDIYKGTASSIQIVTIASTDSPVKMNIIDKNIMQVIRDNSEELSSIQKNTLFSNIVFERILSKQSLYKDIDAAMLTIFKREKNKVLKDDVYRYCSWGHLYQVLKIQAYGGNDMVNQGQRKKRCYAMLCEGKNISKAITKSANSKGSSAVAKIERISYKLMNIIRAGNRTSFFDEVAKLYIKNEMALPNLMTNCLENQSEFEYLSRAFLMGLQTRAASSTSESETDKSNENN